MKCGKMWNYFFSPRGCREDLRAAMPDSENAAVGPAIVVELNFNLIQVLRLVHALVEANCRLHVSPKDTQKFVQLCRIFGMPYKTGTESAPTLHGLLIDHMQPETRVGMIARPLISPLAAFTYCRNRWPPARRVRAAFPGKPTASRGAAIDAWFELSGLKLRVPNDTSSRSDSFLHRLSANIARRLRMPQRKHVFSEGVRSSSLKKDASFRARRGTSTTTPRCSSPNLSSARTVA